ncbi:MAG: hypothetical protein GWP14_02735 [Actinobacteria bacterium]|nr:hypothetical protein [Actinomycetota bacterium]
MRRNSVNPIVENLLAKRVPSSPSDQGLGRFYVPGQEWFRSNRAAGDERTLWILTGRGRVILLTTALVVMLGILLLYPRRPVLPWYCVLAWTAACLWIGRMCIRTSPMLMAPVLFLAYFFVGYPLKIVYGQLSPRMFSMLSTGLYFARKSPKLDMEIMFTALASLVGVALAVKIALFIRAERLRRRQEGSLADRSRSSRLPNKQALTLAICVLTVFVPLLYVFMWRYHIGQTGVRAVVLPYRLSGIAVQIRAVFIPMMQAYLLWQVLKLRSRGLIWFMAAVIVTEAMLCGFLSMSRGAVVARVIVFAVLSAKIYKEFPSKMLVKAIIGGTLLLLLHIFVVVPSITIFRVYSWRGHSIESSMQAALTESIQAGNYETRLNFIFGRMLGVEDLMGVAAYQDKSFSLMYNALTTGRGMRFVNYKMFCLRQFSGRQLGGGTFIGRGMSIIGHLYLSGSLLLVMFGSAVICLLVCLVEMYLDRIAIPASAVWVTISIPGIWEGVFRIVFYALIVFICCSWFLVRVLEPWLQGRTSRSLLLRRTRPQMGVSFRT